MRGIRLVDWIAENPEFNYLLDEWDTERNREELGLGIGDVSYRNGRKVYWKCKECGQDYQLKVAHKTSGHGCKKCAMKKVNIKNRINHANETGNLINWVADHPGFDYLLEEWNTEKNKKELGLTLETVSFGSGFKAYWICSECGNEFQQVIGYRTVEHQGCPECNKIYRISFPEQAIYYYIKQVFPNAINSYKPDWLGKMEIDIYIPELNLGIEYDGDAWHNNNSKDYRKNILLKEHNIELIRMREERCPILLDKNCKYIYLQESFKRFKFIDLSINNLFEYLNCKYGINITNIDINVDRDNIEIRNKFIHKVKENSLAFVNPDIAKVWHPTKNGGLKPTNFTCGSSIKVWWLCPDCGNDYRACIIKKKSVYCPSCTRKRIDHNKGVKKDARKEEKVG